MKIPKTFPLAGNTWTVKYKSKEVLDGDYGQCIEEDNEVWIQLGLRTNKRWQTFLHELAHAIDYTMGVFEADEKETEARSQLLYQALFKEAE